MCGSFRSWGQRRASRRTVSVDDSSSSASPPALRSFLASRKPSYATCPVCRGLCIRKFDLQARASPPPSPATCRSCHAHFGVRPDSRQSEMRHRCLLSCAARCCPSSLHVKGALASGKHAGRWCAIRSRKLRVHGLVTSSVRLADHLRAGRFARTPERHVGKSTARAIHAVPRRDRMLYCSIVQGGPSRDSRA